VESIFEAMSLCASLHPDPNISDEDDLDDAFMDESAFETFTGEEGDELSEVGRVRSDFVNNSRYAPY
jgi:nucleotide-sensitive chloride channel 1A